MSGRARDPNDDIEELKQKVRSNEKKIAEIEQQLQKADEKTKELEDEKKALEKEVDELKKEIKRLQEEQFSSESAITELERKLTDKDAQIVTVEHKLDAMLNRLEDLTKKSQEKDAENDTIKKGLNKLEKSQNWMKEEIKHFRDMSQDQEKQLKECKTKIDELEKSRNILYIGQLCAKVMEAIYWVVLPIYFERGNNYKQPHLRDIDAKIKQLYETRSDQRAAQKRWEKLQTEKIDRDEKKVKKLVDFMEEMLAERNEVAHPCPLNEKELKDIASKLPGQKQQLVEKVIQISKEMMPSIFINVFLSTHQTR